MGKNARTAMIVAAAALTLVFALPLPAIVAEAENGGPRLMRVSPGGEGVLGRDTVVSLSFDRPIDLESLAQAAYFEPPAALAVSGESECLVVPVNLLAPNTRYAFRLKPGIVEDLDGDVFCGEVSIAFATGGDGMILEIPALSYRGEIVEGKDPQGVASVIGFGVGHYPGTGRPGRGNFVVMAHASGQVDFPFNHLVDLKEGDEIRVSYGGRVYVYRWSEGMVVRDTDMWIVDPTAEAVFTAFVCCAENGRPSPTFHPPFRYVVRASLARSVP